MHLLQKSIKSIYQMKKKDLLEEKNGCHFASNALLNSILLNQYYNFVLLYIVMNFGIQICKQ